MWFVKESINYISEPLTYIINSSINSGVVPYQMKSARMVPFFKSGDKRLFSNYRPVSVIPIFSKFLEKIVYFRLINYVDKHKLLASNQYGFRKNHSTSLALLYLYDKITAAVDERKYTAGLFLDLSKAFDTVNHSILLGKLEHYGMRGLALEWVKSYLCKRLQYVKLNGVPQGSVACPLFFLVYINDICHLSNLYDLVLFADDTNLFFSHNDIQTLTHIINSEMLGYLTNLKQISYL